MYHNPGRFFAVPGPSSSSSSSSHPHQRETVLRFLRDGITAVHAQVRARDIVGRVRKQEGDGAHQVLGRAHAALRDERGPLPVQIRLVVQDLLRPICCVLELVIIIFQLASQPASLLHHMHVCRYMHG
jgi:hypothetical protein